MNGCGKGVFLCGFGRVAHSLVVIVALYLIQLQGKAERSHFLIYLPDFSFLFLQETAKISLQFPQLSPKVFNDLCSQYFNLPRILLSFLLYLPHNHSHLHLQILQPSQTHKILNFVLPSAILHLGYQRHQNTVFCLYLQGLSLNRLFEVEYLSALAMYLLPQFQHPPLQFLYKPLSHFLQVFCLFSRWFDVSLVRYAKFTERTALDLFSVVLSSCACLHRSASDKTRLRAGLLPQRVVMGERRRPVLALRSDLQVLELYKSRSQSVVTCLHFNNNFYGLVLQ